MQNFVKDEDYLKHLKEELLELEFLAKSNDLYKFFQVILKLDLFLIIKVLICFIKL